MNYMEIALKEAMKAWKKNEVPIGCVIVRDGKVIAKAHNLREKKRSALAHAEVLAIHKACRRLRNWRLAGCEMYVTLEPCAMCMGAIQNARIDRVVFGAKAVDSGQPAVDSSFIENDECGAIIREFFKKRRNS